MLKFLAHGNSVCALRVREGYLERTVDERVERSLETSCFGQLDKPIHLEDTTDGIDPERMGPIFGGTVNEGIGKFLHGCADFVFCGDAEKVGKMRKSRLRDWRFVEDARINEGQ